MELLIDILGWGGSILVLVAFGLNTYQKMRSDSVTYLILNLLGSIFLIIYSYYYHAYANSFINLVWAIVSLFAFIRIIKGFNT